MYCRGQRRDWSGLTDSYQRWFGRLAWTYLQIVVMTAEVSSGLVFNEQRMKPLQKALCGPMFRHGPHGVVACHQQEVCLGPSQSLLQPGQLTVGIHRTQGASGLLIHEVVRVAAQHYGVEHDDGQRLPRVGDAEVQLVIIRRKSPKKQSCWFCLRLLKEV